MTRRTGITLLMMMVALVILGVFALVSTRLFGATLKIVQISDQATTRALRLESMLAQLRQDVWSARTLETAAGTQLFLAAASGDVTWTATPGGDVTRNPGAIGDQQRQWKDLGVRIFFIVESPAVILTIAQGPDQDRIILPSQVLLARKGPP